MGVDYHFCIEEVSSHIIQSTLINHLSLAADVNPAHVKKSRAYTMTKVKPEVRTHRLRPHVGLLVAPDDEREQMSKIICIDGQNSSNMLASS